MFSAVLAAEPLEYYLPEHSTYDPKVESPNEALDTQVGEWHLRPDQIADYFYSLARQSERVLVQDIGKTHEHRSQIMAIISSPENLAKLEQLRNQHLNPAAPAKDSKAPLVVWLGYSIHGNEASGSNAAVLTAYHLAASDSDEVQQWLANTIVLIDPMLNPDGLGRFAQWVNGNRSKIPNADPFDREHQEDWPRGRGNHYWFDLNRDWLLLQHPESRHRIAQMQRWRPHVVADFHEMGPNSSYFFQPGVPSRTNPLTPKANQQLTGKLAQFHAQALDAIGSRYFTKEGFDDFYYGKGSTYPDVNGGIGILFEQASARGHLQRTVNGPLSFPFAIRNQLTTSLSTLRGAHEHRAELLAYQRKFDEQSLELAQDAEAKGYVFSAQGDDKATRQVLQLLASHGIQVHRLARDLEVDGKTYTAGNAYVVPAAQSKYRLLASWFESRTQFEDNSFYDVSAWPLPLAYGLDFAPLFRGDYSRRLLGDAVSLAQLDARTTVMDPPEDAVALAFDWRQGEVASLLSGWLQQSLPVNVMMAEGSYLTLVNGKAQTRAYPAGTLMLPLKDRNSPDADALKALLIEAAEAGITPRPIVSGLAREGVDLGSPRVKPLKQPKPLLVVGEGINSYQAGQVWFLHDELALPLTKVSQSDLFKLPLHQYTHLILVSGSYGFDEAQVLDLQQWIKAGGVLIATGDAARWASEQKITAVKVSELKPEEESANEPAYKERGRFLADRQIGGSVLKGIVDLGHPLAVGLVSETLPLFRDNTLKIAVPQQPFITPVRYSRDPVMAGYVAKPLQKQLAGSAAVTAEQQGRGSVILLADDPLFRSYWYISERLFINALYFGHLIEAEID